jgi:hypothetical protein
MRVLLFVSIFISFCLFSCNEDKQQKLFEFSRTDNFEDLERLVSKHNLKLDTLDNMGYSPLSYAVLNQNVKMVKFLIQKGATVNYYKNYKLSPFYLSVKNEKGMTDCKKFDYTAQNEIIKFIFDNGLVIDKNTVNGRAVYQIIKDVNDSEYRELIYSKVIEDYLEIKNEILRKEAYYEKHKKLIAEYNKKKRVKIVSNPVILIEKGKVTFKLHNVKPAGYPLWETDYLRAVKQRNLYSIEYCNSQNYKLVPCNIHPFARAVQLAYDEHRPLVISPDVIWLMILQGFSTHIELNKAKYQYSLVDFEGIKRIDIKRDDFVRGKTDTLWKDIIPEFTSEIRKHIVDTSMYSRVVHSFTTSTSKELLAYEITFLEINKHYFDYHFWACGIPEITLEGTVEDWKWIRQNIEVFRKFDLSWWIDKLIPILDQFLETSKGYVDHEFWSSIYRYDEMCGAEITGWFAKFFPYIRKGTKEMVKNPLVLKEPVYNGLLYAGAIENENFTSGLSYVDFTFHDRNNQTSKMCFVSGFVGIMQDKETKALSPEINWLILNK